MSKFHINKHGVPAPCRATKGNCPYGGDSGTEGHFDTQEEAQEHADTVNQKEHGITPEIKDDVGKPKLNHRMVPEFYEEYDDVDDRFHDFIQEGGAEAYDHPSFRHLSDEEKYDVWSSSYSKSDFIEAYNDSYSEEDFDSLKDNIKSYAVKEGMYNNNEEFEKSIEDNGKRKTFKNFNNFLFNGKDD